MSVLQGWRLDPCLCLWYLFLLLLLHTKLSILWKFKRASSIHHSHLTQSRITVCYTNPAPWSHLLHWVLEVSFFLGQGKVTVLLLSWSSTVWCTAISHCHQFLLYHSSSSQLFSLTVIIRDISKHRCLISINVLKNVRMPQPLNDNILLKTTLFLYMCPEATGDTCFLLIHRLFLANKTTIHPQLDLKRWIPHSFSNAKAFTWYIFVNAACLKWHCSLTELLPLHALTLPYINNFSFLQSLIQLLLMSYSFPAEQFTISSASWIIFSFS